MCTIVPCECWDVHHGVYPVYLHTVSIHFIASCKIVQAILCSTDCFRLWSCASVNVTVVTSSYAHLSFTIHAASLHRSCCNETPVITRRIQSSASTSVQSMECNYPTSYFLQALNELTKIPILTHFITLMQRLQPDHNLIDPNVSTRHVWQACASTCVHTVGNSTRKNDRTLRDTMLRVQTYRLDKSWPSATAICIQDCARSIKSYKSNQFCIHSRRIRKRKQRRAQ